MRRFAGLVALLVALAFANTASAITLTSLGAGSTSFPGTTSTVTLGGSVPNGALIVVTVYEGLASSNGTVTDTAGDNFVIPSHGTCQMGTGLGNGYVTLFYAITTGLSSSNTIVYHTPGGASNYNGMNASYTTGASTFDAANCTAYGNGGTTYTSGTASPSVSGDLAVGVAGQNATNTITQDGAYSSPPGTAYGSNLTNRVIGGNETVSGTTATAYNAGLGGTAISGGWGSVVALFKPTGAGPTIHTLSATGAGN